MKTNPLAQLEKYGQSIWLDYIKRDLFTNGKLEKLIDTYCLRGMTSNPSIFEKAIDEGQDYDQDIKSMAGKGKTVHDIYDALTLKDVQNAADVFRSIYEESHGEDGYVSLEVNPHLAKDTEGTIAEARRLWKALDRPNVLIKVPATKEGIPAIQQLITEGINVNVTLLFGLTRYREVVQAYINGLEARIAAKKPVKQIASVASFFLSRIDVLLDPILQEKKEVALKGQIAIASAKLAYQIFIEMFHHERFKKLAEHGANVQRLLWASTSTKNPDYSDVKYVEALIGPKTVNTLPLETIEAYHDHGNPAVRLDSCVTEMELDFKRLKELGIDIESVVQQLEDEGVSKFLTAYDQLIDALKKRSGK